MKISYMDSGKEWNDYPEFVQNIVREFGARTICDVGGGANPVLPLQFINENQLDCTVLDISIDELEKAPSGYKKLVQDIEAENFGLSEQFDFVITKMMAEHISNGERFHKNIYSMLKPGGVAVHYFPTLFALPFLVNKITPEWLSSLLLDIFLPRDRYRLGKFPAYYSWCYGPTRPMLTMLSELGYEILEYRCFFGNIYYQRIPIIRDLHKHYSNYLTKHPNPYFTSFAQVILRKVDNLQ